MNNIINAFNISINEVIKCKKLSQSNYLHDNSFDIHDLRYFLKKNKNIKTFYFCRNIKFNLQIKIINMNKTLEYIEIKLFNEDIEIIKTFFSLSELLSYFDIYAYLDIDLKYCKIKKENQKINYIF